MAVHPHFTEEETEASGTEKDKLKVTLSHSLGLKKGHGRGAALAFPTAASGPWSP